MKTNGFSIFPAKYYYDVHKVGNHRHFIGNQSNLYNIYAKFHVESESGPQINDLYAQRSIYNKFSNIFSICFFEIFRIIFRNCFRFFFRPGPARPVWASHPAKKRLYRIFLFLIAWNTAQTSQNHPKTI